MNRDNGDHFTSTVVTHLQQDNTARFVYSLIHTEQWVHQPRSQSKSEGLHFSVIRHHVQAEFPWCLLPSWYRWAKVPAHGRNVCIAWKSRSPLFTGGIYCSSSRRSRGQISVHLFASQKCPKRSVIKEAARCTAVIYTYSYLSVKVRFII